MRDIIIFDVHFKFRMVLKLLCIQMNLNEEIARMLKPALHKNSRALITSRN